MCLETYKERGIDQKLPVSVPEAWLPSCNSTMNDSKMPVLSISLSNVLVSENFLRQVKSGILLE